MVNFTALTCRYNSSIYGANAVSSRKRDPGRIRHAAVHWFDSFRLRFSGPISSRQNTNQKRFKTRARVRCPSFSNPTCINVETLPPHGRNLSPLPRQQAMHNQSTHNATHRKKKKTTEPSSLVSQKKTKNSRKQSKTVPRVTIFIRSEKAFTSLTPPPSE